MDDAEWDRRWGGAGAGGGGAPRRSVDGGVITDLRNQPSITRHALAPARQARARAQKVALRTTLDEQMAERRARKAQQAREQAAWDAKYGASRPLTAIEQREAQAQQERLLVQQKQQELEGMRAARQAASRAATTAASVQASADRHGMLRPIQEQPQQPAQTAAQRDIAHALANPDKNVQFMTSSAKAAVDAVKREQYLRDLEVQIEDQKRRKQRQKEEEQAEDRRREQAAAGYTPWGRHGAGAPLRDTGGRVITNLRKHASPARMQRRQEAAQHLRVQQQQAGRRQRSRESYGNATDLGAGGPPDAAPPPPPSPSQLNALRAEGKPAGASGSPAVVAALKAEVSELRSSNNELRAKNVELKDELFDAQETVEMLAQRVEQLNKRLQQAERNNNKGR